MSKQIDIFFAPERLRKNWEKQPVQKVDALPEENDHPEEMSAFYALRASLQEHFHGENLAVLNMLMDNLQPVWESLFDSGLRQNKPMADVSAMISMAHELLNEIEDLSFAFKIRSSV